MHLLLALAFLAAPACATAPVAGPVAQASVAPREIGVDTLRADLAAQKVPVLLDVRTPEEFARGHVAGAVNVPLDALGGRLAELAPHKDGEVYLICQSGRRSGIAAGQLAEAGFRPVNVKGGTGAWIAAGLPVE